MILSTVLWGTTADARQLLLGARAGGSGSSDLGLNAGPLLGADATLELFRLLAVELEVEQSIHFAEINQSVVVQSFTGAGLSLQYRLDVASAIPYFDLGVEAFYVPQGVGYGGVLAVGVELPLGESLFVGAEARYGAAFDGSFPSRQAYALRFGWRTAEF